MLRQVLFYACGQSMGLSLGLTQDVFAFASQLQEKQFGQGFERLLMTLDGQAAQAFSGWEIPADCALDTNLHPDLIILHSLWGELDGVLAEQRTLYPALWHWHEKGIPIMAASTATFLLAEAGLLDERLCTTHWHRQTQLKERYPKVNLRPDRFITATGEIYCSAGMNAALEIMVYLLKRLADPAIGEAVEKTFLVDFRSAYQSEPLHIGQHSSHRDEAILAIQQWLDMHFSESFTLNDLAQRSNMSLRTFKRRFKDATGESPLQYVQELRLEQSLELLKHSNQNIAQIAWQVGYEDPGHFNRLFQRRFGESPAKWRRNWRE